MGLLLRLRHFITFWNEKNCICLYVHTCVMWACYFSEMIYCNRVAERQNNISFLRLPLAHTLRLYVCMIILMIDLIIHVSIVSVVLYRPYLSGVNGCPLCNLWKWSGVPHPKSRKSSLWANIIGYGNWPLTWLQDIPDRDLWIFSVKFHPGTLT